MTPDRTYIRIRVPASLRDRIDRYCEERDISRSKVTQHALEFYLENRDPGGMYRDEAG